MLKCTILGRVFLLICGLAVSAEATSVSVSSRNCPVCGEKSASNVLNSYSSFGEPALDLSDQPLFQFADVITCPYDGYSSWSGYWDVETADEKRRLRDFLENPEVTLTPAELEVAGERLEELRQSTVWAILWAKSCNQHRDPDPRREWLTAVMLHFTTLRDKDGIGHDLHPLYRDMAIVATQSASEQDWANKNERLIFSYLIAELKREAGKTEQAMEVFRQMAARDADDEEGVSSLIRNLAKRQLEPREPSVAEPEADEDYINYLPDLSGEKTDLTVSDGLRKEFKGLYEKITSEDPVVRAEAARDIVGKMRDKKADADTADYPINVLFPRLASLKPGISAEIEGLADGDWVSDFWKSAVEWLAGVDGSAERLAEHPVVEHYFPDDGKVYEVLLWECFKEARDPVWVEKAINRLAEKRNLYLGELEYALAIRDPKLAGPIRARHEWLLSQDWRGGWEHQSLGYESMDIEEEMVKRLLGRIPVSN